MSKQVDELRDALTVLRGAHRGDDLDSCPTYFDGCNCQQEPADIARTIVDTLGITRDHAEELRVVHLLKIEPAESIGALAADALTTLLDLAGE